MPEMSQSDHHLCRYTKMDKDSNEKLEDVTIKTSHSTSSSSSKRFCTDSFSSRSTSMPLHFVNSTKTSSNFTPLHSAVFISNNDINGIPLPRSNDDGSHLSVRSLDTKIDEKKLNPNSVDGAADSPNPNNYFDFLDDFIRFDVCRTGVSCFFGYSVGVQYEDDLLVGKAGAPCYLGMVCRSKSRVRLWHNERAFEVEYLPRVSCLRPKDCAYEVKIRGEGRAIGTIHFKDELVHIYNSSEECLALRRKQGSNCYSIKTDAGERLASVEIFRGLRGDILYYGLSILGDASSTHKALLIGLTVAMDIRQRESEMRCSLIWVPLCCVLVIGLFTLLPWLYFYDDGKNN